jgi:hypothetical protein
LRLSPHHVEVRRAYREVGALLLRGAEVEPSADEDEDDESPSPPALARAPAAPRAQAMDLALADELPDGDEDVLKTARVEELSRRLRDSPGDDAMANELAGLLEQLGRGHELVALIAGRLEDAPPERRAALSLEARAVLERMAARADALGESSDASLYRDALFALSP